MAEGEYGNAGLTALGVFAFVSDTMKLAKYGDELGDLAGGLGKTNIGSLISEITKSFDNFQCKECADSVISTLKGNGIAGQVLEISTNGNKGMAGNIWSDIAEKNISLNGSHKAVLVDGKVYDNVYENGIDYSEWIKDIFSPTGYNVKKTNF